MAIARVDNYVEAYRLRALSPDIHYLTARNTVAQTEFVLSQILERMDLVPEDVLVDIGAGDGSLLKMAAGRVSRRIGIVPTAEEKQRLDSVVPDVTILTCLAQELTLESGTASKIVCNAVLFYLGCEEGAKAALSETQRIARLGATIWVGEMPEIDEYAQYGRYPGNSMIGLLWHLLRKNGFRAFLGMCRRWMLAVAGRDRIVLNSAGLYYATPDKLIALAEGCGLRLKTYFRHRDLDELGRVVDSKFRYDYIFEK